LERLEDRTLPSFGFGWAFNVGGANGDGGKAVAVDSSGNVYVSGSFDGTNVNFDPLNSPAYLSGSNSPFTAKYSPSGTLLWATPLGGGGVAVQGSNVYVASGSAVVELDAGTGALGWTVSIPGSSRAAAVAVGQASGNVCVTGYTTSSQAYVAQVSASGVLQWTQTSSTTSDGTAGGNGVAVYDAPNSGPESVYVIGKYNRTVTFGATQVTSTSPNIFVWKLNSDGTPAAFTSLVSSGSNNAGGITVDGAGNPYITGDFWAPAVRILVAKLDPTTLAPSWTSYFNVSGSSANGAYGTAVALDLAGNVYTTGFFSGTFDFDPGPGQLYLTSGDLGRSSDVFVAELDANGQFVAAADMRGSGFISVGFGIAVDTASPANVYTTGQLEGTADFDPTSGTYNLTATGYTKTNHSTNPDVFVSKLTQSSAPPAAPSSTPPASAPSRDQALSVLLVSENATGTSGIDTGGGPRVQTQNQPVLVGVPGNETPSSKPTPTPPRVLPQMTSTGPVDWLFADLGSGGWANAFTALWGPTA
jgi:hypothetical protein